jgi:SEC-C motif
MLPIAEPALPANAPPRFHLLAKPSGATCNIDCKYCFFRSKEALYPDDKQRMSENTLETYRFALSRDGEPGQNYLCAGLELFFKHTRPAMRTMINLLQQRRPPADVMSLTAAEDEDRGPYQPCPCGSGKKFRFCHGNNTPTSLFSGLNPAPVAQQDGQITSLLDESQRLSTVAQGATR